MGIYSVLHPTPSLAVRCATAGSALCLLRTNCPENSAYAGYCCDNLPQCYDTTTTAPLSAPTPLCGPDGLGVRTAIGCLMAGDPKQLVSQLWGWGIGVGGLIAFVLIVFAGFQTVTSAGDPKRFKAAQELMTSAVGGLILIVLSVVLLNFIGVNVLALPGFKK